MSHYQSSTYNTQQRHVASQNRRYRIVFSAFDRIHNCVCRRC